MSIYYGIIIIINEQINNFCIMSYTSAFFILTVPPTLAPKQKKSGKEKQRKIHSWDLGHRSNLS